MLRKDEEQVHAIAKHEIAAAKVELENKIKKLESDLKAMARSLPRMLTVAVKDLEAKIKRETPASGRKSNQ